MLKAFILSIFLSTVEGNLTVNNALTIQGSVADSALITMTPSGTTQTVDWSLGMVQKLDLEDASGNVTLTYSNGLATGVYTLIIQQDGGGSNRTVTFPATVYFAGGTAPYTLTVTATADAIDLVTMVCATSTVCYATASQDHK